MAKNILGQVMTDENCFATKIMILLGSCTEKYRRRQSSGLSC